MVTQEIVFGMKVLIYCGVDSCSFSLAEVILVVGW
jgi:hypothetical protein